MARDVYFDNAKFLLTVLVIVGHAIEPLIMKDSWLKGLYVFLYTFHMYLFSFISGYFSTADLTQEGIKKNINRLLIPYLIFQILYWTSDHFLFHSAFSISKILFLPYKALWFLLSLFFWRMTLPFFMRLRYPMLWALVLALLVGYFRDIGRPLSLSRSFVFFPFFLGGYSLRKYPIAEIFNRKVKRTMGFVLILGAALSFRWSSIPIGWLFGSYSYETMKFYGWTAAWPRLVLLGIAVIMGFAFLAWVSTKKGAFTEWGSRSLYPFLWHVLPIKLMLAAGLYRFFQEPWASAGLFVLSVILCVVLSSRLVQQGTRFLVEPQWIR